MKLKVDENLPASLIPALAGLDHDVESVESEGLAGVVDERVWAAEIQAKERSTESVGGNEIIPDLEERIARWRDRRPGAAREGRET